MDKRDLNIHFKFMSFGYLFRDLFFPRMNLLKEVGIQAGFHILDYGCGSGSYIAAAAELVGTSGKIYALDIHPLAIQMVQESLAKKRLTNVETILSDCKTDLPDSSLDVVLLYDVFHKLSDPDSVLKEVSRVLKPHGILSFSDHHMKEHEIVSTITKSELFTLSKKGKKTFSFLKTG